MKQLFRKMKKVDFRILRRGNKTKSQTISIDFRRAEFGFYRDILRIILWEMALEIKQVQETWLILEDCFLLVQEWSLPLVLSAYFLIVRCSFRNMGT